MSVIRTRFSQVIQLFHQTEGKLSSVARSGKKNQQYWSVCLFTTGKYVVMVALQTFRCIKDF